MIRRPVVGAVELPDGTVSPVRVFRTDSDSEPDSAAAPVVALWPGLGVPAAYYDVFAARLADRGVGVVVAELRGQGASRPRPSRRSDFGQQALVTEDVPAVLEVAARHFPGRQVVLAGHSMGGHIVAMAAARARALADASPARPTPDVVGLVLIASGVPHRRLYRGRHRLRTTFGPPAMELISSGLGYWPGTVIEGYGRQSRTLIRDWSVLNRTGRFDPRGADLDYEAAMTTAALPVCGITVSADTDVPWPVMKALTIKFSSSVVDHRHIATPLGHNRWTLDDETVGIVADWVMARDRVTDLPG
ncbi:alpha/beta fold hydrolase [Gordonia soli]|uniref:Serine aminopeptidase S33 domain-containing protein n=1 Tax=Gordonia soli NBRC 108243 TaxID=1223545 RepID=M0QRH2_9ACTN|nr:alpha/beta fold hydrolase [Gordonia soli]GAC70117.1 hypothetical protein GS4_32_00610 [Gordonia soli NBRC 108243]